MARSLSAEESDPDLRQRHVHYLSDDDVRVVSDHDDACFNGVDNDLKIRFGKILSSRRACPTKLMSWNSRKQVINQWRTSRSLLTSLPC